jgi:hypothetical protein
MPNENAIVSAVVRIEPPLERPPAEMLRTEAGLSVELEEGRRVRLDPDDPRSPGFAEVLEGLRRQRLPVYLELNPETATILRLLIPHVARVAAIQSFERGALAVELVPSQARHLLPANAPERDELERRLRAAEQAGETLLITETDAHEIIDVRGYTPDPEQPRFPFPKRPLPPPVGPQPRPLWRAWIRRIWFWPCWLWRWWRCFFNSVSTTKAQEIFDAMSATRLGPEPDGSRAVAGASATVATPEESKRIRT